MIPPLATTSVANPRCDKSAASSSPLSPSLSIYFLPRCKATCENVFSGYPMLPFPFADVHKVPPIQRCQDVLEIFRKYALKILNILCFVQFSIILVKKRRDY